MPKIKILRIIARLNIGGPAINAILLTEGLNENFESILATGHIAAGEGDMSYLAAEKGIVPVIIRRLGRDIQWLSDLESFWKIFLLIKRERPCIVHTHTAKAGALGRLAAKLAGVPVKVHTFHGHVFDDYFHPAKTRYFILIERFLSSVTDRIIAVGGSVKDQLCDKYRIARKDKIVVVNLGFELERFFDCERKRGSLRRELNIQPDYHLVGIIGRLVPVKNHRMFFDVASKFRTQNSELRTKFLIVGDGELREELEDYSRSLGLAEDVVFLGWRKDLDVIYADLDVVCLTSLNEGTPVSLIEAQASRKPVVATDVGGVRDVVIDGFTGILTSPKDIDGFSKGLLSLLKDKQKRDVFGTNGRGFVREKFAKKRLIRDMENLYRELLEEKEMMAR